MVRTSRVISLFTKSMIMFQRPSSLKVWIMLRCLLNSEPRACENCSYWGPEILPNTWILRGSKVITSFSETNVDFLELSKIPTYNSFTSYCLNLLFPWLCFQPHWPLSGFQTYSTSFHLMTSTHALFCMGHSLYHVGLQHLKSLLEVELLKEMFSDSIPEWAASL